MTTSAIARPLLIFAVLLVAGLSVTDAHAEPQLTEATPPDGQSLDAPPESFRLCFTEPVQLESPDQFSFIVSTPDGRTPGSRTEFASDGGCVTVDLGATENVPAGIWTLDWTVHAQADGSEGTGAIRVQVGGDFGLTPGPEAPAAPGAESDNDSGSDWWLIVAIVAGLALGLVIAAGIISTMRMRRR